MGLLGSTAQPAVQGEGPIGFVTVYSGSAAQGSRLPRYSAIRYRNAYPGIDWVWHFLEGALEFQFELSAGADPAAIRMAFTGARELRLDSGGNLEVDGESGMSYRRPEAWQDRGGRRAAVPVAFRIDSGVVAFEVGAHDPALPLTIDPVVLYSRYLGGAGYDAAYAVATDAAGSAYITGETNSVDFSSSTGVTFARHAFVSKLSPDGTQIVFNVILASGGNDAGKAIALDGSGNVWIAGVAGGPGFPVTAGALSGASAGAEDAFIAKLNSGGQVTYCTYLGGSGTDVATGLALDSSGNVYVAGYTSSINFPTSMGAPQMTQAGGTDAFLVKLGAGGTTIAYATLLGGAGNDAVNAVSVDSSGNACIAGRTDSANLPVVNAVQPTYAGNGNGNGLLACLNPAGTAWNTLTYLGGAGPSQANAMARDAAGNLYLAGDLYSTRSSSAGVYGAFAMKLNTGGTSVAFTATLAGSGASSGTAIAVDSSGHIWVAGYTASVDFPVTGPPAFAGYFDGFVTELSSDGSTRLFSRYLGGSGDDRCQGLAITTSGDTVVTGLTGSINFPTTTGGVPAPYNAFVTRLQGTTPMPQVVSVTPSSGSGSSQMFNFVYSDPAGAADLAFAQALINNALSGPGACDVQVDPTHRYLWLLNDAATAWTGPIVLGSAGTIQNSQCTVSGPSSSVAALGNTVTVNMQVSFQAGFAGAKSVYGNAITTGGLNSGWTMLGTWNVQ